MKRKTSLTRIACGAAALGLLAAAYGTCYMDQVVLCYAVGDALPTFTYECNSSVWDESTGPNPNSSGLSSNYPYAYQNAWMHGVYSVTYGGGFGTYSRGVFLCDSKMADVYGNGVGGANFSFMGSGHGFEAVVYDQCTGITYTSLVASTPGWGGNSNTQLIPYVTIVQSVWAAGQGGGMTLACTF